LDTLTPAVERCRVFRIGGIEFDEGSLKLLVNGAPRAIENIPRRLLHTLLVHAGEVLTKPALKEAAWGNERQSDASLATAMSKLRAAIGDDNNEIIQLHHRFGYSIKAPVMVTTRELRSASMMPKLGDLVPRRPLWRLERLLGNLATNGVWLARHEKTQELRVFKFADSPARLDALKREERLSYHLYKALGERDDIVRVVEADFKDYPFFIGSPYGGPDLALWSASGALTRLAHDTRVALIARLARTVEAAHGVGVLHGDIKPANILVADADQENPRLCLVDFGAGGLMETALSGALSASLAALPDGDRRPGSFRYAAPEVYAGGPPTDKGDVYALGVLLYQMVVGDIGKPLATGWEGDVDNVFLREDIPEATAGDPSRRLGSAAMLAERLENLADRRAQAALEVRLKQQTDRARRIGRVTGILCVMLGTVLIFALVLRHERQVAIDQRVRAEQITHVIEQTVSGLIDDMAHGLGDNAGVQVGVLEHLLDTAQATLTRMISLAPDDIQLRRLQARGLTEFARTYLERDDLPAALAAAERAESIQHSLMNAFPDDGGAALDLADNQKWIGDIKMKLYDKDGALRAYETARDILNGLVTAKPSDAELQRLLARAEEGVGDVQIAEGNNAQALETYRLGEATIRRSFAAHSDESDWLLDLSVSEEKVGDALEGLSDWRGALAAYQADLTLRRQLVERDSGNNAWRRRLSVAESDVGDEQYHLRDFKEALSSYQASLADDIELAHSDPNNEVLQRGLAVGYSDIGDVKGDLGDGPGAVEAYNSAESVIESLAAKSPDDVSLLRDLVAAELNLADGLIKIGNRVQAAPYASKAITLVRKLAAAHPDDPELVNTVKVGEDVGRRAGINP
jgi:serine/threonine protein kinase/DNA-binding winged helix-turn-helix (wHTH) protein